MKLLLSIIDGKLGSWVTRLELEECYTSYMKDVLDIDKYETHVIYELDFGELEKVLQFCQIDFTYENHRGEIIFFDGPIEEKWFNTHTSRELKLMLEGIKPLSAFVEVISDSQGESIIPRKYFQPYVENGKLIHREFEMKCTPLIVRRVLYSLPEEEWRFMAYIAVWKLREKYGWNSGYEQMEGYLLGYEVDVDLLQV